MAKQADNTARQDEREASLYPIRTVSTLTGVNTVTLRAWERRYGLIRPTRTASGHRLYTQAQIDLINRVLVLLDKGIAISQVRAALDSTVEPQAPGEAQAGPWQRYLERMVSAIVRFDENGLEESYNEALSLYPVDMVTRHLLLPLLTELGQRWETAEGSIAEEHFFGVYLRNKLGARFHHRARGNTGPRLLLACLPGELHEIGVLLFALSAHDNGFRIARQRISHSAAWRQHAARRLAGRGAARRDRCHRAVRLDRTGTGAAARAASQISRRGTRSGLRRRSDLGQTSRRDRRGRRRSARLRYRAWHSPASRNHRLASRNHRLVHLPDTPFLSPIWRTP